MFDEIDLDKSGDITIEELQFAIQAVGLQVTEEELLAAFKMASIDAVRHKITFKEFKLLVKQFEDKMKREGYSAE